MICCSHAFLVNIAALDHDDPVIPMILIVGSAKLITCDRELESIWVKTMSYSYEMAIFSHNSTIYYVYIYTYIYIYYIYIFMGGYWSHRFTTLILPSGVSLVVRNIHLHRRKSIEQIHWAIHKSRYTVVGSLVLLNGFIMWFIIRNTMKTSPWRWHTLVGSSLAIGRPGWSWVFVEAGWGIIVLMEKRRKWPRQKTNNTWQYW